MRYSFSSARQLHKQKRSFLGCLSYGRISSFFLPLLTRACQCPSPLTLPAIKLWSLHVFGAAQKRVSGGGMHAAILWPPVAIFSLRIPRLLPSAFMERVRCQEFYSFICPSLGKGVCHHTGLESDILKFALGLHYLQLSSWGKYLFLSAFRASICFSKDF